jgi:hypothetical protein
VVELLHQVGQDQVVGNKQVVGLPEAAVLLYRREQIREKDVLVGWAVG